MARILKISESIYADFISNLVFAVFTMRAARSLQNHFQADFALHVVNTLQKNFPMEVAFDL